MSSNEDGQAAKVAKGAESGGPPSSAWARALAHDGRDDEREGHDTPADHLQEVHSILWTAALGLTSQRAASQFDNRYRLISPELMADALIILWVLQHNAIEGITSPIRSSLVKLGLWYLQPYFDRIQYYAKETWQDRTGEIRKAFTESFGVDSAVFPTDGPGRPAVPAFPELGIQDAVLTTARYRLTTRVRVECSVLHPYWMIREMVYPWNWKGCLFWDELPEEPLEVPEFLSHEVQPIVVKLPGGSWAESNKRRDVKLKLEVVRTPFMTRIDYEAAEIRNGRHAQDDADVPQRDRWDKEDRPDPKSSRRRVEVRDFFGFMLVEKLPGRPGACRVVLEREGSFGHPNHLYFSEETMGYWVTSELLTFVEAALERAKPRSGSSAKAEAEVPA
jgi:hypothetical protein